MLEDDLWKRAADQARRDMARADRRRLSVARSLSPVAKTMPHADDHIDFGVTGPVAPPAEQAVPNKVARK